MSHIEENASRAIKDIFETISNEEGIEIKGYFASDVVKVNGKSCVYPCFVGFTTTSIVLVKINEQLEREEISHITSSKLKAIKIKKGFLSRFLKLRIDCTDHSSFVAGVPEKLKYIEVQQKNIEKFVELFS